ncbi:hypothetical protein J4Q44_G00278730 [Coregonus suidteri]|uniref:Uncharacterized protein n=1 Tax=Coregonus suidteri TaxID=861788 RepID=A0AAN8QER8_9TELE
MGKRRMSRHQMESKKKKHARVQVPTSKDNRHSHLKIRRVGRPNTHRDRGVWRLTYRVQFWSINFFVEFPQFKFAAMFGVSKRTIRRRMQQYSLRKTDLYSAVNDEELDRIVSEIHRSHPNTGYKLMRGHLNARGVHVPSS